MHCDANAFYASVECLYICEVEGRVFVLFYDEPYWFLERAVTEGSPTNEA